jgi:hypothetical protein
MKHSLEIQMMNKKSFDDYRDVIQEDFSTWKTGFRQKSSQGVFWISSDKDLANQFVRNEVWLFGFKIKDSLRLIDHNIKEDNIDSGKKIGYSPKTQ